MDLKSGLPFSLIKSGLVADYPKLEHDIKTDVVIIGGGISGALAAYYLIKNNIPCVVVDARTIGLGSTAASTSLLQYEIDTPLHKLINFVGTKNAVKSYWLCAQAIDKLNQIRKEIKFTNFETKQSLYYAATKKDVAELETEYRIRKQHGFKVSLLKEDAVFKKTGLHAPAAILSAKAAQTDAYLFTHSLLQYNIKKGLMVFDRTPITDIRHSTKTVKLTTENGKTLQAKKIIYATGYETVNYIDKKILKLQSTYAIASEVLSTPKPFWKNDMLIWNTANPYLYIRTTEDNRIIVGGRDENFYSPGRRDKLLKKKTKQLSKDFLKLFPDINFTPEFSWTGTFGSTKDGLPFIGTYNKLPNSYFALGFGGNGITFSLIAAEIITAFLRGKKNKDAAIFSFDRI